MPDVLTDPAEVPTIRRFRVFSTGDSAMGMHRSAKRRRRREDAAMTMARNKIVKTRERARRDTRMVEKVKTGSLPHTPVVMSWLSRKLNKKAGKITSEDIHNLVT